MSVDTKGLRATVEGFARALTCAGFPPTPPTTATQPPRIFFFHDARGKQGGGGTLSILRRSPAREVALTLVMSQMLTSLPDSPGSSCDHTHSVVYT